MKRCRRPILAAMLIATLGGALLAAPQESGAPDGRAPSEKDLRRWLENMVWHHHFSVEEVVAATGRKRTEVDRLLREFDVSWDRRPQVARELRDRGRIKVLPYPGGRHPRIGFLEGAVDPQRDTKVSVFPPWKDAGYVVVDLPEALWSNLGLTYLAHTHIPTIWTEKNIQLERIDWRRLPNGELRSRRRLPNGIEFSARVVPRRETVDMALRLKNGTAARLEGLRTQICVLLKGAPAFSAQSDDNKKKVGRAVAVNSRDGGRREGIPRRWIVTVWERAKPWTNPPCPCMHSDPVFPDLAPGEEAVVRGRIFFWEGDPIEEEIARRERAGTLDGKDSWAKLEAETKTPR